VASISFPTSMAGRRISIVTSLMCPFDFPPTNPPGHPQFPTKTASFPPPTHPTFYFAPRLRRPHALRIQIPSHYSAFFFPGLRSKFDLFSKHMQTIKPQPLVAFYGFGSRRQKALFFALIPPWKTSLFPFLYPPNPSQPPPPQPYIPVQAFFLDFSLTFSLMLMVSASLFSRTNDIGVFSYPRFSYHNS